MDRIDVAKVTVEWSLSNTDDRYLNIFHYRTFSGAEVTFDLAEDIATSFQTAFQTKLLAAASIVYSIVLIKVEGLNRLAFHELPVTGASGVLTGTVMPPYVTWGIRLRRSTTQTRDGWKRFSGLREADVTQTGVVQTSGTWRTAANAIATQCAANVVGSDDTYVPIIYRYEGPDGVPSAAVNDIATAQVQNVSGSQNTRKLGRGS